MATPKGGTPSSGSVKEEVIAPVQWAGNNTGKVVKDELLQNAPSASSRSAAALPSGHVPRGLSPSCSSERNELPSSSPFSALDIKTAQHMLKTNSCTHYYEYAITPM